MLTLAIIVASGNPSFLIASYWPLAVCEMAVYALAVRALGRRS